MNYSLLPERKNILITGAGGFIGSYISRCLQEKYNIFNLEVKGKESSLLSNKIICDLRNQTEVKSYFAGFRKKYDIYAIIHMASKMAFSANIEDRDLLYDNLKIAYGLVEIAELLLPKKLINFSSIAVYPNRNGRYAETSEIRPSLNNDCLYGLSKFCSENILDFTLKDKDILISHLRIAQVHGKGMNKDRIIPTMLKELKKHNRITVFGNGKKVSCFISVEKLSKVANIFLEKDISGIFNVGEENISYLKLAQRLIRQKGDNISKVVKKSIGSSSMFYLNTKKLRQYAKKGQDDLG